MIVVVDDLLGAEKRRIPCTVRISDKNGVVAQTECATARRVNAILCLQACNGEFLDPLRL